MTELVLSLFPGIDLLGRAFELEGFCVVRGPDLIWGQSIEGFHALPGRFTGIIAGSPCQGFSRKPRKPNRAYSESALSEFARVVTEAQPEWWLLENVPTVPNVAIEGYRVQRFDLSAREVGLNQSRRRHFQYGSLDGRLMVVNRERVGVNVPGQLTPRGITLEPCCLASEGKRTQRRSFADFCELQGLPREFDLPGWSIAFKYAAVGNGVPIPMGRCVARAIVNHRAFTVGAESQRICACECGRQVSDRALTATPACRKRMQKKRESAQRVNSRVIT